MNDRKRGCLMQEIAEYSYLSGIVFCFLMHDENVLLIRREKEPYKDSITVPGGKKERGETFIDACVREMEEETGLIVTDPQVRGIAHIVQEGTAKEVVSVYFSARSYRGTLRESDEGSLVWAPIPACFGMPGINPFFLRIGPRIVSSNDSFFASILVNERGDIVRDAFVPSDGFRIGARP